MCNGPPEPTCCYGGQILAKQNPDAAILVHPESPEEVIALADVVGSTTQLIKATQALPNKKFIVATDNGIFYKMKQAAPDKVFMEAPSAGEGATCESCAHCPWMAMNNLHNLAEVLQSGRNEIFVPEEIREKALRATQRMIDKGYQISDAELAHANPPAHHPNGVSGSRV